MSCPCLEGVEVLTPVSTWECEPYVEIVFAHDQAEMRPSRKALIQCALCMCPHKGGTFGHRGRHMPRGKTVCRHGEIAIHQP